MEQEAARTLEIIEIEEGRPEGPRWAEVQQESLRTQRADIAAIWCRRVAGLLVWGFVGIIISQLWTVAWKLRDLKLLALCLLITASLLYIFYKRYRHIRDIGLTGVDLVRAMTVDDGENGGLHGVTRKARASCVDFKFDPQATFQERPLGRGFERYPPPAEVMLPAAAPNSPGGGVGDDEEAKDSERKRRRGIISWFWRWGRNVQEVSPGEDNESTEAEPGPVSDTGDLGEENTSLNDLEIGRVGAWTGGSRTAEANGRSVASRAAAAEGAEGTGRGNEMLESGVGPRGRRGGQLVRASELNPSCSVCLFEYYLDEEVTLLPCGHLYHTECIDIWMRDHVDCPYCRADINVWATVGSGATSAVGAGDCLNRTSSAAPPAPASTVGGSNSSSPRPVTRMRRTRSGLNASSSESNG